MSPAARATIMVVAVASVLSGCGPVDKSHSVSGQFSGNKTIALSLGYGGNSSTLAASAYADVADGTAGTVEVTGGQHWRCQGQFRTHQNERGTFPWDVENFPEFIPPTSSDPVLNFGVPSGSYVVTVRIPAMKAELKESARLEQGSGPNPQTLLYFHDRGCVLIADTLAQQKAYVTQYLDGMKLQPGASASKTYARLSTRRARKMRWSIKRPTRPSSSPVMRGLPRSC